MKHTEDGEGQMLFLGITGGVGAGKSEILHYIGSHYRCRILEADRIAEDLMRPGTDCYAALKPLFYMDQVYQDDGTFDRKALAAVLFNDPEKKNALEDIVHPAVRAYVLDALQTERMRQNKDLLVLEAALLIEAGYDRICDEVWLIDTDEPIRIRRLMESRGYTEEKARSIIRAQLSREEFLKHCSERIDNSHELGESCERIDQLLALRGIRKNGVMQHCQRQQRQ